ncbi:hypothetical protein IGI04_017542 [Brassica rapa subsp. trilocularis]|uniref:K-box domain-containing protein n=1 Tax=Brassica rapa subsp. trilocularis TaxID=1813537 RepID=A0ABQ7MC88_BRACM|nr:hypothetical protein IGI04_017542 [Brassica rapa subsp. trilocularis]
MHLVYVRGTIERYKKACSDAVNPPSVTEANTQYYQQESSKLRRQIRDIQNLNRHILGESLGSLNLKELKNLEGRLEKGIGRVRSKKVNNFHFLQSLYMLRLDLILDPYVLFFAQHEMLVAEIEYMQKREIELQNDNMYLRSKINERAGMQQQEASVIHQQGTVYESSSHQSEQYNRNYIPVNLLEPNQNSSDQNQPPLQLV